MSAHGPIKELPKEQLYSERNSGPVMLLLGAVGGACIVAAFIWGVFQPAQFGYSWLYGFSFYFTICAGALFWVILHHATNAGWSVTVRRQAENVSTLFPYLVLFFIPVALLAKDYIYGWMRIDPAQDHLLHTKAGYLNPTFFWIRCVAFFAFFTLASLTFRRLSTLQDKSGDPQLTVRMQRLSFICLPLFAVSLSFASIDWLKSLDYTWFSTMWGVYIFAGSALSSMAVLILIETALRGKGYLEGIVHEEHFHIMGKLLLAFSIFWAYIGFSQYMLIWYANIPEETSWFIRRNTETWNTMNIILVIGHFFVPFLLLLRRRVKQTPRVLSAIAIWILAMHALDLYIIVLPIYHASGVRFSLLDLLPIVGIGCILAFFFLRRLANVSLFPVKDPRIVECLELTN